MCISWQKQRHTPTYNPSWQLLAELLIVKEKFTVADTPACELMITSYGNITEKFWHSKLSACRLNVYIHDLHKGTVLLSWTKNLNKEYYLMCISWRMSNLTCVGDIFSKSVKYSWKLNISGLKVWSVSHAVTRCEPSVDALFGTLSSNLKILPRTFTTEAGTTSIWCHLCTGYKWFQPIRRFSSFIFILGIQPMECCPLMRLWTPSGDTGNDVINNYNQHLTLQLIILMKSLEIQESLGQLSLSK